MLGMKSMKNKPQNNDKLPELLTLEEASRYLKCHPNTLRSWDKKGILPAIRIGVRKVRRYKKIDLEKFVQSPK
ncbi:MAG: DNA-binding protein [Candidatus Moranbacteria bacterium]|nr:DNA-binding protein [Candidatus Moranbacteria bacterium]